MKIFMILLRSIDAFEGGGERLFTVSSVGASYPCLKVIFVYAAGIGMEEVLTDIS